MLWIAAWGDEIAARATGHDQQACCQRLPDRPNAQAAAPACRPWRRRSARQHGTAVAALLVGQGEIDGLLAGWELVAADPYRKGDIADGFSLIKALDLLVAAEVRVINLSLAGPSNALVAEMIGQSPARASC